MKTTELETNSQGSAEIISIRAEAPRDVCEKIAELLSAAGFSTSGMKPRVEADGTWRYYFTELTRHFRETHGLIDLDTTSQDDTRVEAKIRAAEISLPKLRNQQATLRDKLAELQKQLEGLDDPLKRVAIKSQLNGLGEEVRLVHSQISHDENVAARRVGLDERRRRLADMERAIPETTCSACGSAVRLAAAPEWLHQPLEQIKPKAQWYLDFTCTRPPIECGHRTRILFPEAGQHKSRRKKESLTQGYLPSG